MPSFFEVDAQSDAVKAMAEEWSMLTALIGGTNATRKVGKELLPQWPKEYVSDYSLRLNTATLFPAFSRTCVIMAAKPFARPINMEGQSPEIENLFENIDRCGTDLHAFAYNLMLNCMQYGLVGVLADYPTSGGILTKADETDAGLRPYLSLYTAPSILGWRIEYDGAEEELIQLRLLEYVEEPDGQWATKKIKQVRVLTPGTWEIWRELDPTQQMAQNTKWAIYASGTTTLDKIPFVFFYGNKKQFGIGQSPLIDLAYLNVEHYQSASDQQTILHVARVPVLFAKRFSDIDPIVVGGSSAVRGTEANSDLKYVEHSGAAIEAGRQSLLDLEDRMRQTGAELLVQQPMTATATQIMTEREGPRSILQSIVEMFEDSLEAAMHLLGEWIGQDLEVKVELYKDFSSESLSEASANTLLNAERSGIVSKETAFTQLQRSDIVPHEIDWEEETARINSQPVLEMPGTAVIPQVPGKVQGAAAQNHKMKVAK